MKIGVKNLKYSPLAEDEKTYTKAATKFSGAVSVKGDPQKSDSPVYVDDELYDEDKSITSEKITLVVSGDENETLAEVLGRAYSTADGTVISSTDDPIFIGIGYVVTTRVNKKTKYQAMMYPKVKFEAPSSEVKTREEKTEFQTTTLDGTAYYNADGKLKYESPYFEDVEGAKTYLDGKFVVKETTSPA